MYAPQTRHLVPGKPLEDGDDVAVYQEVLHRLGFLNMPYRAAEYAQNTWEAVERFGKAHGIEPNNVLGTRVHNLLVPHMTAGQRFRLAMFFGDHLGGRGHRIQQAARWAQDYWLAYQATRPLPDVLFPLIPQKSDCSFFYTRCLLSAGFASAIPQAQHQGDTRTLVNYGTAVNVESIEPGDAVFVNGPEGVNSHMFVAATYWNNGQGYGISHGMPGNPNNESYTFYPIYAVRRYT